jgi:hypothetical protein
MAVVEIAGQLQYLIDNQQSSLGLSLAGPAVQFKLQDDGTITSIPVSGAGGLLSDPEVAYRSESALRTVVDYIAGRGCVVPLDAFTRVSRSERQPIETGPVADFVDEPYPGLGMAGWLVEILFDALLWDRWMAIITQAVNPQTGQLQPALARVAPWLWRYGNLGGDNFSDKYVTIAGRYQLDRSQIVTNHGRTTGTTASRSLEALLIDLQQGSQYREQTWLRGARASAVLLRPAPGSPNAGDVKDWSDTARMRFSNEWKSLWAGNGPEAGGTPILEDGMTFQSLNEFSARDTQWQEGRTLTLVETCSFFHLAPELAGIRPSNYATEREKRKGLYEETLGPILQPIGEALTHQYVRQLAKDAAALVAFNVDRMIQGTFDEIVAAVTTAVGGPWLLRDEGRDLFSRGPLPDDAGKELITPLNVTEGGLPSPHSTAPGVIPGGVPVALAQKADGSLMLVPAQERIQLPAVAAGLKAARRPGGTVHLQDRLGGDLADVYQKMRRDVKRQLGMKAALDWDSEKWSGEVTRAVLRSTPAVASAAANQVLAKHAPDQEWSDDPMQPWLDKQAEGTGDRVSTAMHRKVADAIGITGEASDEALGAVFDDAEQNHAPSLAAALVAGAIGLGTHDAAVASGLKTKTWKVTSANPRDSHAAVDGETVDLTDVFSLGGRWPGDAENMDISETAGCTCLLDVSA